MPTSRLARTFAAMWTVFVMAMPAQAQVSLLPADIQEMLATVGPRWGKALGKNIEQRLH